MVLLGIRLSQGNKDWEVEPWLGSSLDILYPKEPTGYLKLEEVKEKKTKQP